MEAEREGMLMRTEMDLGLTEKNGMPLYSLARGAGGGRNTDEEKFAKFRSFPSDVPNLGILLSLINGYFSCRRVMLLPFSLPRFLERLSLESSHIDSPHPSLLHAIAFQALKYSPSPTINQLSQWGKYWKHTGPGSLDGVIVGEGGERELAMLYHLGWGRWWIRKWMQDLYLPEKPVHREISCGHGCAWIV
ncbi:hypothetical protein BT69DRAFT_869107 [Atractiella rhizophila]|nr:hypothetical protein BT69DRAFT_869107 [Atractiella rhizophila]